MCEWSEELYRVAFPIKKKNVFFHLPLSSSLPLPPSTSPLALVAEKVIVGVSSHVITERQPVIAPSDQLADAQQFIPLGRKPKDFVFSSNVRYSEVVTTWFTIREGKGQLAFARSYRRVLVFVFCTSATGFPVAQLVRASVYYMPSLLPLLRLTSISLSLSLSLFLAGCLSCFLQWENTARVWLWGWKTV